jgi:hypothetical protein
MGTNRMNVLMALPLLLIITFFSSCQKDHDLVASYVIQTAQPLVEQKGEQVKEGSIMIKDQADKVLPQSRAGK